jgi:hypothetical protein
MKPEWRVQKCLEQISSLRFAETANEIKTPLSAAVIRRRHRVPPLSVK